MFIAAEDKAYYADTSGKASGFRGMSDVDIRKSSEWNENIWISGGAFPELIYLPFDYTGGEDIGDECIAYLVEHDQSCRQQYEKEINDRLDIEDSSFPDDTEFDDYDEYLNFREEVEEEYKR